MLNNFYYNLTLLLIFIIILYKCKKIYKKNVLQNSIYSTCIENFVLKLYIKYIKKLLCKGFFKNEI